MVQISIRKLAKEHWPDVIVGLCILCLLILFLLGKFSLERWEAKAALAASFIAYIKRDGIRATLLFLFTVVVAFSAFFLQPVYVSAPDGTVLHQVCKKYMQSAVDDGRQSPDNDHDTFSADCELAANGDDSDATKIPRLPGLTDIQPSFNSQIKRTCNIDRNATKFTFFHAGLIQKSAKIYRFNIPLGGSFTCEVKPDQRKNPTMDCPFNEKFLDAFRSLPPGEFTLTVQVSTVEEGDPLDFSYDCSKT